MTRMTKKIHLAVLGTALTLNGCGQKAPPPPLPIRAAEGDWGNQPRDAHPPVIVSSTLLGTTHLIVQGFGAQGGLPLGPLAQSLCAVAVAEGNVLPTVVFADDGDHPAIAAALDQEQRRHTTTTRHHSVIPSIIILGGGFRGPSYPAGSQGRPTTTSRPSSTSSAPGSSSSVTTRGFGSTGGAISGSGSS